MRQLHWKTGTIAAATLAILLGGSTGQATDPPEIPYVAALQRADVAQEKMAAEIPGALILGNGDLNGILWVNQGRLRFSITKNDACDARLETADDPEITRIDIKNRKCFRSRFDVSRPRKV